MHTSALLFGILSQGGNNIWAHNMVPFYDSPYYIIDDRVAYSQGASVYGEPPNPFDLHNYKAEYGNGEIIIYKESGEDWDEVDTIEVTTGAPTHINFTFDQNGYPVVVWEVNKRDIYLFFYDTSISDTTVYHVGSGRSPHVIIETYNGILKPVRQVFLLYCTLDDELMLRQQDERYRNDLLLEEDVHAVVTSGHTIKNSAKVIYLKRDGAEWEFDNLATDRLGEWAGDAASDGQIEFIIDELEVSPVIFTKNFSVNPVGVEREAGDAEVEYVPSLKEFLPPVENPVEIEREVTGLGLLVRSLIFTEEFEEDFPEGLTHDIGLPELDVLDVRLDITQSEVVGGDLILETDNPSMDLWVDKSRLSNYYNQILGQNLNETYYTEESWQVFSEAMGDTGAVLADETAGRTLITETFYDLRNARLGLKYREFEGGGGDPYWDNVIFLSGLDGGPPMEESHGIIMGNGGTHNPVAGPYSNSSISGSYIPNEASRIFTDSAQIFELGNSFTIEAWVKPDATLASGSYQRGIAAQWDYRSGGALVWFLGIDTNGEVIFVRDTTYTVSAKTEGVFIEGGTWTHVAVSVTDLEISIYLNGIHLGSGTAKPYIEQQAHLHIGGYYQSSRFVTGELAVCDLRITKDIARYTENFTPPTEPFPNFKGNTIQGDPYWESVIHLYDFDDNIRNKVDGIDLLVNNGNEGDLIFDEKDGRNAIYFDGTNTNDYKLVTEPTSPKLEPTEFTIEAYVFVDEEDGGTRVLVSQGEGTGFNLSWWMQANNTHIRFTISRNGQGSATENISAEHNKAGQWMHVAITKDSLGNYSLYVDGILLEEKNLTDFNTTGTKSINVGWLNYPTQYRYPYIGFISNLRITQGVVRYTTNFIPPRTPFPDFGGDTSPPENVVAEPAMLHRPIVLRAHYYIPEED